MREWKRCRMVTHTASYEGSFSYRLLLPCVSLELRNWRKFLNLMSSICILEAHVLPFTSDLFDWGWEGWSFIASTPPIRSGADQIRDMLFLTSTSRHDNVTKLLLFPARSQAHNDISAYVRIMRVAGVCGRCSYAIPLGISSWLNDIIPDWWALV